MLGALMQARPGSDCTAVCCCAGVNVRRGRVWLQVDALALS